MFGTYIPPVKVQSRVMDVLEKDTEVRIFRCYPRYREYSSTIVKHGVVLDRTIIKIISGVPMIFTSFDQLLTSTEDPDYETIVNFEHGPEDKREIGEVLLHRIVVELQFRDIYSMRTLNYAPKCSPNTYWGYTGDHPKWNDAPARYNNIPRESLNEMYGKFVASVRNTLEEEGWIQGILEDEEIINRVAEYFRGEY